MRSHVRNGVVVLLALGLLWWFLRHADLAGVWREIRGANVPLLLLSALTMFVNHVLRAARWQYLLAPIGSARFINLFRATVIGFAALFLLPARAGEFVRAYVLARKEGLNTTATFATIVLERVIDLVTVLLLFGVFLAIVPPETLSAPPAVLAAVKTGGLIATAAALVVLAVTALMAHHPERLARVALSIERVLPGAVAHAAATLVRRFADGLAVARDPSRVLVALVWSIPLWLSIATGIWSMARAFDIALPFAGSFLIVAFLTLGVMVPTPGAVGGFHEAFRYGTTAFFAAPNDRAIAAALVLHAVAFVPTTLVGILFMAQDGLTLTRAGQASERAVAEGDTGEVPVLRPSGR